MLLRGYSLIKTLTLKKKHHSKMSPQVGWAVIQHFQSNLPGQGTGCTTQGSFLCGKHNAQDEFFCCEKDRPAAADWANCRSSRTYCSWLGIPLLLGHTAVAQTYCSPGTPSRLVIMESRRTGGECNVKGGKRALVGACSSTIRITIHAMSQCGWDMLDVMLCNKHS